MTQVEAAALLALMLNAYPNARFTEANAQVFERELQLLEPRDAQAAVEELMRTCKYVPSISEIRGEVTRIKRDRVAREDASRSAARRLGDGRGGQMGPRPHDWKPALDRMLEASSKHQAMARDWYAMQGKPLPPDPGLEFMRLAEAGARGVDVRERVRKAAGIPEDDSERRFP